MTWDSAHFLVQKGHLLKRASGTLSVSPPLLLSVICRRRRPHVVARRVFVFVGSTSIYLAQLLLHQDKWFVVSLRNSQPQEEPNTSVTAILFFKI